MPRTPDEAPEPLVDRPAAGRVVTSVRKVRLADVHPGGRLRLDAAARYAQDVAADDSLDAALPDPEGWVVRRTVVEMRSAPRYLEPLTVSTWCSGTGSHYAERRVQVLGEAGGRVEVAGLWVQLDPTSGRPAKLGQGFQALYGEAAGGRRVKGRLHHEALPDGAEDLERLPWALRSTDFDVLAHVNNAAYWEVVEEVLHPRRALRVPVRAEVEHRSAVERGASVEVLVRDRPDGSVAVWLLADGVLATTAVVAPLA